MTSGGWRTGTEGRCTGCGGWRTGPGVQTMRRGVQWVGTDRRAVRETLQRFGPIALDLKNDVRVLKRA
jgi:hypothetical protein